MNEEKLKIGMYTENEIFNYMTEQEGGMLGRSMYDAIFDKIHAQITEIEQLKKENQQLKKQLEASEKARKEAIKYLTSYESISEIQGLNNVEKNKRLDEKTINEMVIRYLNVHDKALYFLDIDKGE